MLTEIVSINNCIAICGKLANFGVNCGEEGLEMKNGRISGEMKEGVGYSRRTRWGGGGAWL